jgi:major membrane immunogen (membrane-anchored lipoprotein)
MMFTVMNTTSRTLVALTAAALLVAGCGSNDSGGAVSTSSAAAPSNTGVPQMSDQQSPTQRVVVDVTIKGGTVTPTNEQVKAKVGEPIVFAINSDAADQLHVHSNPEHEFTVAAKPNQMFQFTVTVPGNVDVELHGLNRTIATIQVQ